MTIGERITLLIKEKGQNSYQCSVAMGISSSRLFYVEKGRNLPSSELIIIICKYFNVSADWLLGLKEERN